MSKKLFRDQFAVALITSFIKDRDHEGVEPKQVVDTAFDIANLTVARIEEDCENCKEEADTKVDVGDLVAAIIADFKRTFGK